MRFPLFLFDFYPSVCLFCGSLVSEQNQICSSCSRLLGRRVEAELRNSKVSAHALLPKVTVRHLFDWRPDEDPLVSKLVVSLKEGRSPATWNLLAECFEHHHVPSLSGFTDPFVFVPIPGRIRDDHAAQWAKALAQRFGGCVRDCLLRADPGRQRERALSARRQVRFHTTSEATSFPRRIVIVDDILTTGSTTKAAVRALEAQIKQNAFQKHCNSPAFDSEKASYLFEIWTLAHRSRLAPFR